MFKVRFVLLLIVLVLLTSCQTTKPETDEIEYFQETAVQNIALAGELTNRYAEISSLAWYGDYLILLPQFPNFYLEDGEEGYGFIFAIAKGDIDAYLSGERYTPLEAIKVPLSSGDIYTISGTQGFEAIVFDGDTAYLTIEMGDADGMFAYLLTGTIAPDLSVFTVDIANMTRIEAQTDIDNMSEETIFLVNDGVVTIHEANGVAVSADPVAHLFNTDLSESGTINIESIIEYRVTDATALDENYNFWIMNYFWSGEEVLKPKVDPVVEKFGEGPTHRATADVERLLEFNYSKDGITRTKTPPIMMQLQANGDLRNYEGIVRYENGFLLATDVYPTTLLSFVPLPENKKN